MIEAYRGLSRDCLFTGTGIAPSPSMASALVVTVAALCLSCSFGCRKASAVTCEVVLQEACEWFMKLEASIPLDLVL